MNTEAVGLGRTGAGLGRIGQVFGEAACFQGREPGSSPTSGTVFPQVRWFFDPRVCTNCTLMGPFGGLSWWPLLGGFLLSCGWAPFLARYFFMTFPGGDYMICLKSRDVRRWRSSRHSQPGRMTFLGFGVGASAYHNGTVIEDTPEAGGQTALPGLSDAADRALRRDLEELRLDNARLRKLLELTEAESKAAHLAQAVIPVVMHPGPVTMESSPDAKVRLFQDLFRARSDVYAVRWENSRDGRSGWVPVSCRLHRSLLRIICAERSTLASIP